MRTALVLLFLLALAAVPGSLVPQRGVDAGAGRAVRRRSTRTSRPGTTGSRCSTCLLLAVVRGDLPAAVRLAGRLRAAAQPGAPARVPARRPPRAPRNLARLPVARRRPAARGRRSEVLAEAAHAAAGAAVPGRRRGRRALGREGLPARDRQPRVPPGAAAAPASRWPSGTCSATRPTSCHRGRGVLQHRDGLRHLDAGRAGSTSRRSRRSRSTLDDLKVRYQPSGQQRGAPRDFQASVRYTSSPDAPEKSYVVRGQPPAEGRRHEGLPARQRLRAGVHGARPHGRGRVRTARCRSCRGTANDTSVGVRQGHRRARRRARLRRPLPAHRGDRPEPARISIYPALELPRAVLSVYAGDLGLDSGAPQSVYSAGHQNGLTQVLAKDGRQLAVGLAPHTSVTLPDGRGRSRSTGCGAGPRCRSPATRRAGPALGSALLALAGLMMSLFVRRRRVWVRAAAGDDGRTLVEVGGAGAHRGRGRRGPDRRGPPSWPQQHRGRRVDRRRDDGCLL